MAVSAGLGLDSMREGLKAADKRTSRAVWVILALATAAALALGGLDYFEPAIRGYLVSKGFDYPEYNKVGINIFNAKRALFFFILSAAALYAGMKARSGALAAVLLISILGVDLFFAHNGYYHTTRAEEYHAKGPVLDFLSNDTSGLFRVYTTPRTAKQGSITLIDEKKARAGSLDIEKEKVSGYSLEHKVFDTSGVEVMRRADYSSIQELLAMQGGPDATNVLKMLNVKYLISIPEIDSTQWKRKDYPGWSSGDEAFKIYENQNFLPRHYMAYDYRVIKKPDEYISNLLDKGFDPGRTVLLETDPAVVKSEAEGKFSVEVISYRNNSSELKVSTDKGGILVASESWYPGWKAFVDGKEVKLLKADLVLRAVALTAGEHTVKFVYSPASFKIGAAISGATAAFIIFFFALQLRRGSRP
ncbi:MAG: YfhO family protein [Deltaproteobacteria bacterium]|nr:YfhO family protein [Deltaproteobacteria bacterium]